MFRTISITALAATATFMAAPALAQSSPVLGSWATAVQVQDMKIEAEMTFTQTGGGYDVAIKDAPMPGAPADAPPMESKISDVVVDGSKFSFKRAVTTPQGAMNLTYTGTVDGNALTGEVDTGEFGKIPVTGTRK